MYFGRKCTLFVFKKPCSIVYAAKATSICCMKRTNDVSPHPSLIWYSLSVFLLLVSGGTWRGRSRPANTKAQKVQTLRTQARGEYKMSFSQRGEGCQYFGSIFRHPVAWLGTGGEGLTGRVTPVRRHHFSKWAFDLTGKGSFGCSYLHFTDMKLAKLNTRHIICFCWRKMQNVRVQQQWPLTYKSAGVSFNHTDTKVIPHLAVTWT